MTWGGENNLERWKEDRRRGCRGMFYGILFSAVIVIVVYAAIKWLF